MGQEYNTGTWATNITQVRGQGIHQGAGMYNTGMQEIRQIWAGM